jgi:hypothetical protein
MSETTEVLGTPPIENIEVTPTEETVVQIAPDGAVEPIVIQDNDAGVPVPETEFKYVGDLVKLAEAGDKDALLKRANEIEAGFSKVHEDREFVTSTLEKAQTFANAIERLANYEDGAIEDFVGILRESNIDPEILLGVKPKPVKNTEDSKYKELESKLNAIEQEKRETAWLNANAEKLLNAVKPLSKLEYKPEHLLKARAFLPKQGSVTPDKLLLAIHQANPELTLGLLSRQPTPATPTMGTSTGAGASRLTASDMSKMSPAELRAWYQSHKGN